MTKYVKTFAFNSNTASPVFGVVVEVLDSYQDGTYSTPLDVQVGHKWLGDSQFALEAYPPESLSDIRALFQKRIDDKFTQVVESLAARPDPRKEQVWGLEVDWARSILADDADADINRDHIAVTVKPSESAVPLEYLAAKVLVKHEGFKHMAALSTGGRRRIEERLDNAQDYIEMIAVINDELANEAQTVAALEADLDAFIATWTAHFMAKADAIIQSQSE